MWLGWLLSRSAGTCLPLYKNINKQNKKDINQKNTLSSTLCWGKIPKPGSQIPQLPHPFGAWGCWLAGPLTARRGTEWCHTPGRCKASAFAAKSARPRKKRTRFGSIPRPGRKGHETFGDLNTGQNYMALTNKLALQLGEMNSPRCKEPQAFANLELAHIPVSRLCPNES